ncbi:hypothetical protein P7C70_g4480, partial [Phenoliferia sp. Uapishka_3]
MDLPPAPSQLVANALDGHPTHEIPLVGDVDPTLTPNTDLLESTPTGYSTPSTINSNPTSGASSPNLDSGTESSAERTTTTVTTREPGGKEEVTTIAYKGVSGLTSKLNKDGSLSIKPVARKGAKVRTTRTVAFTPRTSQFDRDNQNYQVNATGFFTLFWITVFIGLVRTGVRHYNESGSVWGSSFAILISEDAKMLALSDAVMVASTFLCVPFVKAINKGWIRYYWTGAVLQHALQAVFLFLAVRWTFHRVQSGFMTLHSLTLLMKMHSYCSHNGELSSKSLDLIRHTKSLDSLISSFGGRPTILTEARSAWSKQQRKEAIMEKSGGENLKVKQMDFGVRRRKGSEVKEEVMQGFEEGDEAVVMTWHPDERISDTAAEIVAIKEALVSTGIKKVEYPKNLTYWNFIDYLLVPTLVYQLEYPRTDR